MSVTLAQLRDLRTKYHALAVLREQREHADRAGLPRFSPLESQMRRAIMKGIAGPFPGALRELDEARAEELRARETALDEALAGGPVAVWMEAAVLFHQALREALLLRRGMLPRSPYWGDDEAHVRAPPTGRLLDVVWTAVAGRLGVTPREAELLVYPRSAPHGTRR